MKKAQNFSHAYQILKTFLEYGLDEKLPKTRQTRPLRWGRKALFWLKNRYPQQPYGLRLRNALQELGPVWVKFGQMLSTRRELFPAEIADELALLQDNVPPFEGKIARREIEKNFSQGKFTDYFTDFNEEALASASIAQVHTARLKATGQEVVIKILRPNIEAQIYADLSLMYRLSAFVPKLAKEAYRLRAQEVVAEYEKTLRAELDLRQEMQNSLRLKENFAQSELLDVPTMFSEFCTQNMLVEERIFGTPIWDFDALKAQKVNFKTLAERGVQVFFTQVFRDSFFHADMHPGNIFVDTKDPENPKYILIDCGIVGELNERDKRYLAESFVAFFNRDYYRVAKMHVEAGWTPEDTDIEAFARAFHQVCEPIFSKSLAEISFADVLMNLFNVARDFNMQVQPQLVLLQKTMLYVEGLGRQLYPDLDLWATAKPFLQNWLKEQMGLKRSLKEMLANWPYVQEQLPQLPEKLIQALDLQKRINGQLLTLNKKINAMQQQQSKQNLWLISTIFFSTSLFLQTTSPLSAVFCFMASVFCFLVSFFRR